MKDRRKTANHQTLSKIYKIHKTQPLPWPEPSPQSWWINVSKNPATHPCFFFRSLYFPGKVISNTFSTCLRLPQLSYHNFNFPFFVSLYIVNLMVPFISLYSLSKTINYHQLQTFFFFWVYKLPLFPLIMMITITMFVFILSSSYFLLCLISTSTG